MRISRSGKYLSVVPVSMFMTVVSVSAGFGATPTEEMSRTVEVLCPKLKGANAADPGALTAAEKDVLARCAELKLKPGQSYANLTASQLDGLDNMTNDESSVMGAATVEMSGAQNIAILGRLSILRSKSAGAVAAGRVPGSAPPDRERPVAAVGSRSSALQPIPADDAGTGQPFDVINGYQGRFSQMNEYGKWGFFVNGTYGTGDKDPTSREPGFDFDSWGLVAGVDYRLTDQLILGFALNYAATESSIDSNGGDVDLDGVGGSVYGTYYLGNFYVDFMAGLAAKDYDTQRNVGYSVASTTGGTTVVNQVFNGSTDADDLSMAVGTGYNLALGGFSLTPYVQLAYLESDIDGYTESLQGGNSSPGFGLALSVDDQEVKSLASIVGVQFARVINTSRGVLTPYLRADWEHEFENDDRNITARFAAVGSSYDALNTIIIPTDEPDRNFFNFGAGLSAVLAGGWQCFLDYSTVFGYEDITLHRFVAGVRFEF
jgi:outer membrane autotransporter protein